MSDKIIDLEKAKREKQNSLIANNFDDIKERLERGESVCLDNFTPFGEKIDRKITAINKFLENRTKL